MCKAYRMRLSTAFPSMRWMRCRNQQGPLDHVVFQVAKSNAQPMSAQWFYRDRSTVAVSISSARDGDHLLPQAEAISVVMPHYVLDATSTFGHYDFDAPIPDAIFATATK